MDWVSHRAPLSGFHVARRRVRGERAAGVVLNSYEEGENTEEKDMREQMSNGWDIISVYGRSRTRITSTTRAKMSLKISTKSTDVDTT